MPSVPVRRPLALAVALALLLVGSTAGVVGAQPAAPDDPATTIRISLQPDGDARFSVSMRFPLDSSNETRAFDRLADDFEAGDASALSVDPFRRAADLAGETTGRDMTIRNVSRTATRSEETGRLVLSFTWTSFARVADRRMELGDVFETPSGTWLPALTDRQALVVEFPDGFRVVSSSRGLTNGTFHIRGPETFDPGEPWASLERQDGGPTTVGNGTRTPTLFGLSPAVGGGLVLLAVVVAVLLLLWRRRSRAGAPATPASDGGPSPPASGDAEADPGDGAADSADAPPEELLSDEERVLRLLASNDGRMKQADIVTETDWSNAKVSQLLSEMDERDQIEKLRIGRENLISLPDRNPDDID